MNRPPNKALQTDKVKLSRLLHSLRVDVNEQNPEAVRFYEANGFHVIRRSPVDDGGRPFPLLHLREVVS
jgi:capsular polysaccharide biosynthesis protein